jgi:DNA (cytosine-5)-methyltransferase 1
MRYLSVCAGIEAATCAWHPLGWQPVAFSEVDRFPSAVLAHHYPDTPNVGDMTKIATGETDVGPFELLVGGTPCQSFSVAGLRKGLADPRGNLAIAYLEIARRYRPQWLVWENVPGVLSSNGGRDFGSILGGMGELGYGFAYRVLDAQYFGVAQRRRRVFVVGCLGDWRGAAAVLFERHSLQGHPAPRREAGETAAPIAASGAGTKRTGNERTEHQQLVAQCVTTGTGQRYDAETETLVTHSLRADGLDAGEDGTGRGTPLVPVPFDTTQITSASNYSQPKAGDPCHPLAAGAHPAAVAFTCKDYGADAGDSSPTLRAMGHDGSHANAGGQVAVAIQEVGKRTGQSTDDPRAGIGIAEQGDPMFTLQAGAQHGVSTQSAVRRLTPAECEALQGFPRGYTAIPYRNGTAADGPRYKALGNSMAVPVVRWIGERIQQVERIHARENAA